MTNILTYEWATIETLVGGFVKFLYKFNTVLTHSSR